jgi:hypothetical protein
MKFRICQNCPGCNGEEAVTAVLDCFKSRRDGGAVGFDDLDAADTDLLIYRVGNPVPTARL